MKCERARIPDYSSRSRAPSAFPANIPYWRYAFPIFQEFVEDGDLKLYKGVCSSSRYRSFGLNSDFTTIWEILYNLWQTLTGSFEQSSWERANHFYVSSIIHLLWMEWLHPQFCISLLVEVAKVSWATSVLRTRITINHHELCLGTTCFVFRQ